MKKSRHVLLCGALCSGLAAGLLSGCATTSPPPVEYGLDGVVRNGTVETRVGELTFENGYPSRESVEHLFDTMDFQRATQAYIWALPIVAMAEWQQVHEKQFGAKDREIVVYESTEEKLGILTANATTPYVIAFNDLSRSGPIMIEVPAGPTGGLVNDFWQRPVVDLGLAGPDKGKGGKYLILGPGQEKPEGIAADYVYESGTMNILLGTRILTPDPNEYKRLLESFLVYPASNPDEVQQYAKAKDEWFQYQPRGLKYWEQLHAIYQREPVAERDRFMLASLRSLGIEKGKPFKPDARQKAILEEAALVGEAMAQANSFESRFPGVKYRGDADWEYVIFLEPSQRVGEHEQLDERAAYTYEAVTTSAGMTTKTPGVGQAYLGGYRDSDGDWLDGSKDYKLTIPPNAPMKQFWSITLYSQATRTLIDNGTGRADRSSRHDLVKNADGSVNLYFGPGEAPKGMENNFVKTNDGEGFFVYLRLYAPTEPYFERSWKLSDIEKIK
ncbi:MAG: DUF1254 domain-containing protein [Gammaproteobacteria bacterium]|nr:DUF1254 domain-containing protein [Gammaproteobacteria bacterium]